MTGEQLNDLRKRSNITMVEICSMLGVTPTNWSRIVKMDVLPPQLQLCANFIEPQKGSELVREFISRMHDNYGLSYAEISNLLCLHSSASSRIMSGGKANLTTRRLVKKLDEEINSREDLEYWQTLAKMAKTKYKAQVNQEASPAA